MLHTHRSTRKWRWTIFQLVVALQNMILHILKLLGHAIARRNAIAYLNESFHGKSSNGCSVKNFKFLQIATIDETFWEEMILKIWKSNIFSLEDYGIFSDFCVGFREQNWNFMKFDHQFWLMYSIPCSQFLQMLNRVGWLYGKVIEEADKLQ